LSDISSIIKIIAKIVSEEINGDYRLFLFGSRAKENCNEKSDIDVGILSDHLINANQMLSIKEKIEEIPTLLKIDFVDFNTVSDDFRSVALKNAKEITIDF
jgi:predicted nucleotidyltransferase